MTMGMDKLLHLLSTVSWKNFCASSALEAKIDHSGSPAEGVREWTNSLHRVCYEI